MQTTIYELLQEMAVSHGESVAVAKFCSGQLERDPGLAAHCCTDESGSVHPGALVIAVLLQIEGRLSSAQVIPPPHCAELREACYRIYDLRAGEENWGQT